MPHLRRLDVSHTDITDHFLEQLGAKMHELEEISLEHDHVSYKALRRLPADFPALQLLDLSDVILPEEDFLKLYNNGRNCLIVPDPVQTEQARAQAMLIGGNARGAKVVYEHALERARQYKNADRLRSRILFGLAGCLWELQQHQKAIATLRESARTAMRAGAKGRVEASDAHRLLITMLQNEGDLKAAESEAIKAISNLNDAMDAEPRLLECHLSLGNLYYVEKRFHEAVAELERAEAIANQLLASTSQEKAHAGTARCIKAACLNELGKPKEARALYRQGLPSVINGLKEEPRTLDKVVVFMIGAAQT
ncbi:MAG TPA: tetratricopeptide repeat protein, partial [Nitrososphaera sp.]|nr:tetratricopeptide repeat protein [Nitrososphaera sp.]